MAAERVLIVEDENVVALFLQKKLQNLGYDTVYVVSSSEKALEIAQEKRPEVVLMDINIEGDMDGIETADILMNKYDLVVIYLTAYSDQQTVERAKATEPYGYLIKPFEPREIKVAIDMALYKHEVSKKLRESEARYRLLAENMRDIITTFDSEDRCTYVSPSVETILGHRPEQMQGLDYHRFIYEEDRDELSRLFEHVKKNNESYPIQLRFYDSGNNLIWLEMLAYPRKDEDNNIIGIQASSRNAHQRIEVERENRQIREKLEDNNKKLKALTVRLQSIQEEERQRLSQEIHDELGQDLIGLKMETSWIAGQLKGDNPNGYQQLQDVTGKMDDIIQKVRRIATNLRPVLLDKLGLVDAMESELENVDAKSDISIEFNKSDTALDIDKNTAIALYRVFQESLTNILKHANASLIKVDISQPSDSLLQLEIEDDGVGLNSAEDRDLNTHGILGMRERIQNLGGVFNIRQGEEAGTIIKIEIPLNTGE